MVRGLLLFALALAAVVIVTWILARYVFPEWVGLKETEAELEKRRLERDETIVEAAEEESSIDGQLERERQREPDGDPSPETERD